MGHGSDVKEAARFGRTRAGFQTVSVYTRVLASAQTNKLGKLKRRKRMQPFSDGIVSKTLCPRVHYAGAAHSKYFALIPDANFQNVFFTLSVCLKI